MHGIDGNIAELGHGAGLTVTLIVAVLLGLRHATDPDHLTAVSTLALANDRSGSRAAAGLGLAWGLGHAATLLALGLPVVFVEAELPTSIRTAAETAVGGVLIVLAVRLLLRWRRGHLHLDTRPEHLWRTPLTACGVGMLHGIAGSAGVGVLLVGAVYTGTTAATALAVFALAAALSMALVSAVFGCALSHDAVRSRLRMLVPLFVSAGLAVGVWYAASAAT